MKNTTLITLLYVLCAPVFTMPVVHWTQYMANETPQKLILCSVAENNTHETLAPSQKEQLEEFFEDVEQAASAKVVLQAPLSNQDYAMPFLNALHERCNAKPEIASVNVDVSRFIAKYTPSGQPNTLTLGKAVNILHAYRIAYETYAARNRLLNPATESAQEAISSCMLEKYAHTPMHELYGTLTVHDALVRSCLVLPPEVISRLWRAAHTLMARRTLYEIRSAHQEKVYVFTPGISSFSIPKELQNYGWAPTKSEGTPNPWRARQAVLTQGHQAVAISPLFKKPTLPLQTAKTMLRAVL